MVKRFGSAAAVLGLIVSLLPTPAISGQRIIVSGGTVIAVLVANPISSSTAKVGNTFAIEAQSGVVADGWIAISKGASGEGAIQSVDHAGSPGHPGSLGIEMNWIYAADGEKIHLTSQNVNAEGESKAGVASR